MQKDLVTVLQRLQMSALNIIKTGQKRRMQMKEFRCFYFPEKNNAMEKEREVEPRPHNLSMHSMRNTAKIGDQRKVFSDQSHHSEMDKKRRELFRGDSDFSILDNSGEDDFEIKSTQVNNLHWKPFGSRFPRAQSGETRPAPSSDSEKKEQDSIILKVTTEKQKLKKQIRFNLSTRRLRTKSKVNFKKTLNRLNVIKAFTKITFGNARMRKNDQRFGMSKFTSGNFRKQFHSQLR